MAMFPLTVEIVPVKYQAKIPEISLDVVQVNASIQDSHQPPAEPEA